MWYLAEILLAEPQQPVISDYHCEACNVVFQAADSEEAYRKALVWGNAYASEAPATMQLLGVSNLTTIGEDLRDGTEVCGRFFRSRDAWDQIAELVPAPEQLKAIQWERNQNIPIEELLSSEQIENVKRAVGPM
jgi:hypothetical protein